MALKENVTSQGQAWDQIAKDEYDSEMLMHKLLQANPDHLDVVLFSGEEIVQVPEVADDEKAEVNLPPWKR